MNVTYRESIKYKVRCRILKMKSKVFLRSDLVDFGNYRQLSRALSSLVNDKLITRIGHGIYAKLRPSTLSNDEYSLDGSFQDLSRKTLTKLKVNWLLSDAEKRYNLGLSTQIPANNSVIITKRFNRKISWKNNVLQYEIKNIPSPA